MENGWQMRCGLKLPSSSSSSRVTSSLEEIQFQEARNQMNLNISHCILPHDAREQGLLSPQMKQASTSNILNFGSCKPIHPEAGSSFHSLLSVPPPLSQYDFQRQSNMHSSGGCYILDTSVQGNVGMMPSWPLLQNGANYDTRAGVNVHPVLSGPTVSANTGSTRGLSDDPETLRGLITHTGSRNESGINTSLQKGVTCTPLSSSDVLDASLQTPSPISKKQNSVASGCPRVFCMGACGDLLLSSTGLFGILCSCHGMHMSVSRFCEHSGLSDVNPGYAVRMDSGESIAQWRKVYLEQFGIRAPGDHRGWDWPEGLLATSGLANSSMPVAERRKVFDLSSLFNSSAESVNSTQPRNNVSTSRPHSAQEYSNQMLNAQWENGCDHCNMDSSRRSSHNMTDNAKLAHPTLRSLTPSFPSGKKGLGDDCQSRSFHFISSCENSFSSAFQNVQSVGSKANKILKDDVLQRGAIPSSIELKLGQPSQLSWGSGSAALSAVRPHTSSVQTNTIQEKLNHNLANAKVTGHSKQHNFRHPASDFSRTKESFQAGPPNKAPTPFQAGLLSNTVTSRNGATHAEHSTNRLHNNISMSVPVPPSNTSAGGSLYHKETSKRMKDSHLSSPWTLHCQPHVDRSILIDFSCTGDAPVRALDINKLALPNNKSRTMDATCGHKDPNFGSESSSRFYTKEMESSSFSRIGEVCNSNSNALSAAIFSPLGMTNKLSGVAGPSNNVGNACNLAGNLDREQLSKKTRNSFLCFKATPTLQATSNGFSPLSAVLAPGLDSAFFSEDIEAVNSHTSDESLRLLALRNVDKSSKEPLNASLVFTQQPQIHSDQRQQSKNCRISGLRAQDLFVDQGSLEGHRHRHPCPVRHIVSPTFLPDASSKNGRNLGAMTEEMRVLSELTDKYNEDSCNLQPKQKSSLSVGRRENVECDCNMVQRCYGRSYPHISGRCNCNFHTLCTNREQDCNGSGSMCGLKNQESTAVLETPTHNCSRFSGDCVSIEKAILMECKRKEHNFKLDCQNSQWTDVPQKANTVSKVRCSDGPVHLLDSMKKYEAYYLKEPAAKGTARTNQAAELLKGKELSDISSGCSAPAATQASNEVNVLDSCIADAGHTVYDNGQVADQGSAISRSCSSVEAIDSVRSSELVCDNKTRSTEEKSLTVLANVARHGLSSDCKLTHSKLNELQNFTLSGGSFGEISNELQDANGFKPRKRKRTKKWRMLGTSSTASEISSLPSGSQVCAINAVDHHGPTSEDAQVLLQSYQNSSKMLNVNSSCNTLERRSALFSVKKLSRKRDLNGIYNTVEAEAGDQRPLKSNDDSTDMAEHASAKKLKQVEPSESVRKQMKATEAVKGYWLHDLISDGTLKCSSKGYQKAKPVACGKYGIICNQELDIDQLKPPKIVLLSQVLKASNRCAKFEKKPGVKSKKKKNTIRCSGGRKCLDVSLSPPQTQLSRYNKVLSCHSQDIDASFKETQKIHLDHTHNDDLAVPYEVETNGDERNLSDSTGLPAALSKNKEIRMRSLYELSMRGNKSISADISRLQNLMCAPSTICGMERIAPEDAGRSDGGESRASGRRSCRKRRYTSLMSEMGELCCVCGISNKDNANCLLECGHCSIRIHQACYGISRVPKGDWYCRPCRTSSRNVACVLCGYGGGAMTRAFGSRNVVKSLLKAWDIRTEPHIMSMGSAEALYFPAKMECLNNSESATYQPCPSITPVVHNSIISGLFDPTVKQWVHMVCGLWTPGTRCPNVDTMSAFDVSGVSHLKEHMICYICKRPGGSCIRCRVETCHTHFHPWCGHQKGLLQSEVEGVDSDQVGFYGRCLLHANSRACHLENDNDTDKSDAETVREQEPTCARTEIYQRKPKGDGGHHSSYPRSAKVGCLVTQVQLDAWLYINRHKLGMNRQPKLPVSDVDHDCRKEYARYRQAKGWKHLVVYKSGIHALGLYTSRFIQRGAMVVEYVGEIVGHRVADKRETEYLSGRKLQYKSACYFFRIDKEQIIDATCKGGIARFVNHSCQPNCVAKVLTVRGEKKVVFFAQRDIYPGEEITYDYHFNHEDEGKKIPCFCNSKNCRRYLN